MAKRLNVVIPDELHKNFSIALAANETDFSKWAREHIEKYVEEAGKKPLSDFLPVKDRKILMQSGPESRRCHSGHVYRSRYIHG